MARKSALRRSIARPYHLWTELLPEFDEWRTRLLDEFWRLERDSEEALLRRGRTALVASYLAGAIVSGLFLLA